MAGDQIAKLGDSAKATVATIRAKLDELLGAGGRTLADKLGDAEVFAKTALEKAGISIPPSGSLSSVDARRWYLEGEARIPELLDKAAPLEEQAMQAWALRNEIRTQARDAMSDQKLADKFRADDPNLTWQQVVEKYGTDSIGKVRNSEELFLSIVDAAQRSRKSVNQAAGLNSQGR